MVRRIVNRKSHTREGRAVRAHPLRVRETRGDAVIRKGLLNSATDAALKLAGWPAETLHEIRKAADDARDKAWPRGRRPDG